MDVLKDIVDKLVAGGIVNCSILTPDSQIPELFSGKSTVTFVVNNNTARRQVSIGADGIYLESRDVTVLVYGKTFEQTDSQVQIVKDLLVLTEGPNGKMGFSLPRINEYAYISSTGIIRSEPNQEIQKAYSIKCLMGLSVSLEYFRKI